MPGMKAAKQALDLGIICSDIEKSLAFYRDLLGLPKSGELEIPGMGIMHRLTFGDSDLKLWDPAKVPAAGELGLMAGLGFRYITFKIDNLEEVCKACEEAGVKFDAPRREAFPGVWLALVRDPDGNVVEFVEMAAPKA
ncbi:Glyoxalase/Bleomycin resistance protein/Dihydroxybiphenyl dioxygenase [Hyaloraphidium curvatum]|nr:Glyoxalase/Bleomycin resistance protein/Dihydroxybiphenyl dioxygenase [Hyaloraphidium curvatum]